MGATERYAYTHKRMYNHTLASFMVKALIRADGLMRQFKIDADAPLALPQLSLTPEPPHPLSPPPHTEPLVAVRWGLTHLQLRLSSSSKCVGRVCARGVDDDPDEMEKQTDR